MRRAHLLWLALVPSCGFPKLADVPATQIVSTSGDGQTGVVASALATPLAVTAEDAFGNPIGGALIAFGVVKGDGTLSVDSAVTDEQGLATTSFTLGTTAGDNEVRAVVSCSSLPGVTFFATGIPDAAATMTALSGDGQVAPAPGAPPIPLAVKLQDRYGNGVAGVAVQFTPLPGSGTLATANVQSDSSGVAKTQIVSTTLGKNHFQATSQGLAAVDFTIAGIAGFQAPANFAAAGAQTLAAGDLNGDGSPDLAVASLGTVSVLLNTTAANATTPTFASHVDFAAGAGGSFVALGDLNSDGKLDIVVANRGSDTVSVFLNTTTAGATTPTLAPRFDFATGMLPSSVAIADLNGDGEPDLVVPSLASSMAVFLSTTSAGATTPSFASPQTFTTGSMPDDVAIADLDGDHVPDIVVADDDQRVTLFHNSTAAGAMIASLTANDVAAPGITGASGGGVAIGDLNGDGMLDIAATLPHPVDLLRNTGGTFSADSQIAFTSSSSACAVALADVNADGMLDAVISDSMGGTASVWVNLTGADGIPRFPGGLELGIGASPTTGIASVATADFNGDGKPDFAVANNMRASATVVLSK